MATNKTMEDWFLRGGERPQENGMQQVPDDGEKAEYTVAVRYWRKVQYEAFVDVEADNPADAIAQAREMYEDCDLDPEEIDSEDFGEPEFEVDP